jgi:hypothetical protein
VGVVRSLGLSRFGTDPRRRVVCVVGDPDPRRTGHRPRVARITTCSPVCVRTAERCRDLAPGRGVHPARRSRNDVLAHGDGVRLRAAPRSSAMADRGRAVSGRRVCCAGDSVCAASGVANAITADRHSQARAFALSVEVSCVTGVARYLVGNGYEVVCEMEQLPKHRDRLLWLLRNRGHRHDRRTAAHSSVRPRSAFGSRQARLVECPASTTPCLPFCSPI